MRASAGSVSYQAVNGRLDLAGDTVLRLICNNNEALTISDTGAIDAKKAFITNGSVYLKNLPDGASQKQVLVGDDGRLFKSTTTTYSTEEVDKKLAIKDKLIESLTKRLDELEKKVK